MQCKLSEAADVAKGVYLIATKKSAELRNVDFRGRRLYLQMQLELRVNENRPEEELLRHDVMRHHEASCTRLHQVRFTERQDERTAATVRSRGSTEYQYCK